MRSRTPLVVAGAFAALVVVANVLIFTGDDGLGGVFAVILAMPWILLFSGLADALAPSATDGVGAGLAMTLLGGAINTVLVYVVARLISTAASRRRKA